MICIFLLCKIYLKNTEIIKIPYTDTDSDISATTIPGWVKNNAGWWAVGVINDTEFKIKRSHDDVQNFFRGVIDRMTSLYILPEHIIEKSFI